jgi:diguanylate cyclase (GGDEF)-like protein
MAYQHGVAQAATLVAAFDDPEVPQEFRLAPLPEPFGYALDRRHMSRPARILVVDDEPDIAIMIKVNLRSAGYDVAIASNGEEALAQAQEMPPDLVLLDIMMPGVDGFEVLRTLGRDPRFATTCVIMVTAKPLQADKVRAITQGADDYIVKPFDPVELLIRVKRILQRRDKLLGHSPLTGLPSSIVIRDRIEELIRDDRPFALLYLDLDNFKVYNDKKGPSLGDRVIQATAGIIEEVVSERIGADALVGHVGGDDFLAIVPPEAAEETAGRIVGRFDLSVPRFYEPEELERGFVEATDRRGELHRFPLVSISIGIATTETRAFTHYAEVEAVATEMKQVAKREPGSSYAVDRRMTKE